MHFFKLRRHFQRIGFSSPNWQRAKILFKKPFLHIRRFKDKLRRPKV